MTVHSVAIGEVAIVNPKQPVSLGESDLAVPFLPMAAIRDDGGAPKEQRRRMADVASGYTYFEKGDILLAKITPCFENGKVAHLESLSNQFGFGSTEFHVLKAGSRVDPRYLFHAVRDPYFRRAGASSMTGSAGQRRVPAAFVARHRITLPSLSEQQRVAAMLDRADGIQRKRRESVRLVDELLRSAYVSIVGAGNSNYRHWPEMEIADLAERRDGSIRTGPFGSALRHGEFTNQGEVAVLGIDNVVENCFRWTERRFISRERYEKHFKRYTVRAGDVLVTIMGTTGKSAVAPEDLPVAISTKHLAVISLDQEHVRPEFLSHAIHGDPRVWAQIGAANRGAIMAGLNLGIIKRLRIRLPPVVHQARFERVVERVRHLRAGIVSARQTDEHLFRALAQGSFVVDMQ